MDESQKTEPATLKKQASSGGVKDTIESILVAFILAFVFRAFVVEAFVIPTGSMAPTLLGAHTRFTCPDCGYAFTVNYSADVSGEDVDIPARAMVRESQRGWMVEVAKVYSLFCPNCGFKIPREQATGPTVHYGDRILVQKYLYLFNDPKRWDVVVFKSPTPDHDDAFRYQTNFIKRLVGKPGESIMVLDGDVYKSSSTAETLKPNDFQVQTKPKEAQDALWRIVYDNDFYPHGGTRADGTTWHQPWTILPGQSGWQLGAKEMRAFHFDNLTGSAALQFDPKASPNAGPLTDWLAYDQVPSRLQNNGPPADTFHVPPYISGNPVSDLRLSFFYDRASGDGPLQLRLSKLDRTFTAEIFADHARLLVRQGDGPDQILIPDTPIDLKQNSRIDFQNVDYQVTLRLNNKAVLQTTPDQYAPDVMQLLQQFERGELPPTPTVQIVGNQQSCVLAHVSLWRDVYYTNRLGDLKWAMPRDFPSQVARLGDDEYFVLGDNSAVSLDARYWRNPIDLPDENLRVESGRVPGRFLLGKAFFVYWPAGFRPLPSGPALIPNFGQMRFIH